MVSLNRQLMGLIISVGLWCLLVNTRESQPKGDYTSIIILFELLVQIMQASEWCAWSRTLYGYYPHRVLSDL